MGETIHLACATPRTSSYGANGFDPGEALGTCLLQSLITKL